MSRTAELADPIRTANECRLWAAWLQGNGWEGWEILDGAGALLEEYAKPKKPTTLAEAWGFTPPHANPSNYSDSTDTET